MCKPGQFLFSFYQPDEQSSCRNMLAVSIIQFQHVLWKQHTSASWQSPFTHAHRKRIALLEFLHNKCPVLICCQLFRLIFSYRDFSFANPAIPNKIITHTVHCSCPCCEYRSMENISDSGLGTSSIFCGMWHDKWQLPSLDLFIPESMNLHTNVPGSDTVVHRGQKQGPVGRAVSLREKAL